MSQRQSGYERKPLDFYATPSWVTETLLAHLVAKPGTIWECAAGKNAMVKVLTGRFVVLGTDLNKRVDFLKCKALPDRSIRGIITNPPYVIAGEFCEQALRLTQPVKGFVAMLLRVDFDSASSRRNLFADCPAWSRKLVLNRRIVWFTEPNGKPKSSPSENHAWYVWDWQHQGPPVISYGP